jgi:hypothetical protein
MKSCIGVLFAVRCSPSSMFDVARLPFASSARGASLLERGGFSSLHVDLAQAGLGSGNLMAYCRMVPDATELGARLAALQRPGFAVQTFVHPDDGHNTVPPAGIARGIRFALREG